MKAIIRLTQLEADILREFTENFNLKVSILQLTKMLRNHYPNVYKTIKQLEKKELLQKEIIGKSSIFSLNKRSLVLPSYLAFVEENHTQSFLKKFLFLNRIIEEVRKITPISCIGIFGSQITRKATKKSDIDLFVLVENDNKLKNFIPKHFPELEDKIHLTVISFEDFIKPLRDQDKFTISLEILKNKRILVGAEVFYLLLQGT